MGTDVRRDDPRAAVGSSRRETGDEWRPTAMGWKASVGRLSWALYDWANSPFTTLIVTFIFPAYFQAAVVGDPVKGQAIWGYVIAGSGILIAIVAPPLGAIADVGGSRKPWVLVFTAICAVASALLWFVFPSPAFLGFAVVCVVIANVGFEFGVVFNNAMLPDLTPPSRLGRLSGWAWGLGYAGGLTALTLALLVLSRPGAAPLGLDRQAAEDVRIIGPLVGIWLLVFSMPLFLFTWDRSRTSVPLAAAVRSGLLCRGRRLPEGLSRRVHDAPRRSND